MITASRILPVLLTLWFAGSVSVGAQNLLQNPGFEDGQAHWTVENTLSNGAPYFYRIGLHGGGHGAALPYSGAHAVEIYSSDRITRLSQPVALAAGRYRITAQACNQGGDGQQLLISLGEQMMKVPVVAMDYRPYFADFNVATAGTYRVNFVSSSMGMKVDDLALTRMAEGDTNTPPYLFFNLSPTSPQRSRGVQTYLAGQSQWVNFSISCTTPKLLGQPRLHLFAPTAVKISGINTNLLEGWRATPATDAVVQQKQVLRAGVLYNVYSIAVPRFVNGPDAPVDFGGFWVDVPAGGVEQLLMELEDNGRQFPAEVITLVPIRAPLRQATPRKILTVAYAVQDWKQSLTNRLAALPRQFSMMGFNVWSDYGLPLTNASPDQASAEEQVRLRAYRDHGVRTFWPNFSSLFETAAGNQYVNLAISSTDPDRYLVRADGTSDPDLYNMRYAAQNGRAWRDSVLVAYQGALARPIAMKFPFKYTGFINDSFEGLVFSFDKATLADFAKSAQLEPASVTIENLTGKLKPQWLSYNMALYSQVVRNWADAMRQTDPRVKTICTLNTFGPMGSESLPVPEQMTWAKAVDYTMPQWYAMRHYGPLYHEWVTNGVAQKVYGKATGHADVIPLLNLSMGADLADPNSLRFMLFDLLSASPVVKGIGYYIAANAFADGQFMAGLSEVHTLLADVEDYYADGRQADASAPFTPTNAEPPIIAGLDPDGQPSQFKPTIETDVRVHVLGKKGRIALLTVISHCNQGLGQAGVVRLSPAFLKRYARNPSRLVVIDWLHHRLLPFAAELPVDTTQTANLAVLEIADKSWVEKKFPPGFFESP